MPRNRSQDQSIESRLISLFASLFFSVPTAAFIWFWANLELAVYWDGFLSSRYLILHHRFRGVGIATPESVSVYSRGYLAWYSQNLALVGMVDL